MATKPYNELSEDLKEIAREINPTDYEDYVYNVQGVEIPWCAK